MTTGSPRSSASFNTDDHRYMARALGLAKRGLYSTQPNPRVGCVLVRDGQIAGEGWHAYAGGPHAEIVALKSAAKSTQGATAYVTLEPCCHHGRTLPCTERLITAQLNRVVVAMPDPNPQVAGGGIKALAQAGIEVAVGLNQSQAEDLNRGFIQRMRIGRPWVRLKMAASLDARTAMASGESQWITGEAARIDVQRMRAASCAIVTGINTVLADDPRLTARVDGLQRQPLRVVLDSHGRLPANARLLSEAGQVLIATVEDHVDDYKPHTEGGAEVIALPTDKQRIDLEALLRTLADREINELMVEAGATLSGAFVQAGLVDELVLYLAPSLLGTDARGLFTMPGLKKLEDKIELSIEDVRSVGSDLRISALVKTD